MALVPFGEWLPDLPPAENPGATVIKNCYPKTQSSYGPFGGLANVTAALNARCQGAVAARTNDGAVSTFAGTISKLYKIDGTTIDDASSAVYTTSADETWRFLQFGSRVIATNYNDAIQSFVMGSSTNFADLAAAAPKARHIATVKDFVMVGNTYDASNGALPGRVWWPAIDDPTNWPTPGTNAAALVQSDYNDMPEGGWVQSIVGACGGADGAVFMDTAIWRIQYEGPPTVFGFYQVEKTRGTPAPNSVVNVGAFAFYLGEDGFYVFNGASSEPIGANKVDKWFFSDLDQSYFHRIVGAADPINKLVFWAYPGSGSSGGTPNRLICFNWVTQRWTYIDTECETIFRDLTSGYTLDSLDGLGYTLDSLPLSLDSRAWTGGRLIMSAFDTSHRLARFTGSSLAATFETGEINGSGRRVFVRGFRAMVDGGTVTGAVKYRDAPGDSLTTSSANPVDADGVIHHRISARYARAQVNVASGGSWSHAQGIEPDVIPDGER